MHWNRITGESVKHKQIKMLVRFALQRKPSIAKHDLHLRRRIREIRKERPRKARDRRIQLIKSNVIPCPPIGRERARPEANGPDVPVCADRQFAKYQTEAAF